MGFLQKVHLEAKYKKGRTKKVVDMLSKYSLLVSVILQNSSLAHESYIEQYVANTIFKDVCESLTHGAQVEEVNYHVHNRLFYHLGKLCIPQGERRHVIMEAHSSVASGHVGVGKEMAQLQIFFYFQMNKIVHRFKMCHNKHKMDHKF